MRTLSVFLGAALACAGLCFGQEFRGSIAGRVTDPSGAPVPSAGVVVTNVDTNAAKRVATSQTGDYSAPFLPPGPYRIEVSHAGFKTFSRSDVVLRVQDRAVIDIALEVGALAETVTVSGEAPLLDASSASLGEVVTGRTVVDMPLNGRNPFTLVGLVPGALPTGRSNFNFFERTSNAGTGSYTISISGGPPLGNELLLDGVSMVGGDNGVLYAPSVDATQEFKVQTNNFDAETGRYTGGLINSSTKSGTNEFHGSLFEFHRNSALNARDYYATSKPQFQYNQFGGSAGGPVYLPRLYRGKDRTFFFFNYEGSREGVPRSFVSTVPTAAETRGDFSQSYTRLANGSPAALAMYDPATTRLSGTAWVRDAFPGNVIPASRFDPVARNIVKYFPAPVTEGDPVTHVNNYPLAFKDPVMDNGFIAKVDHHIGQRHQFFARASWRVFRVGRAGEFKNTMTADRGERRSPGVAVDDTVTLSPSTVLDVRYGLSRMTEENRSDALGIDPSGIGFPAALNASLAVVGLPAFNISGYRAMATKTLSSRLVQDSHSLRSTVSRHSGRHSLRTGFEARLIRVFRLNPGNAGSYTFDRTFTRGPNPQVASTTAGNGLASFLLGLGASGTATLNSTPAEQTPYYAFHFQDDIRLTSRLTVNLGIRYEWEGAHTERFNRFNRGFTFTDASPIEAQAKANYAKSPISEVPAASFNVKGGILFAGAGGQPRGIANPDRNNIAPRVGAAYSITPRTVLRGGYGLFYGPTTDLTTAALGFSASTSWVTSLDGGLTPKDRLNNPFPNGLIPPTGSSLGLMTYIGQSISFVNPDRVNPYSHQFEGSIQRQLRGNVVVEAAYSGSRGRRSSVSIAADAVPDQYRVQARETFLRTGRNVLNDSVANPFRGLISAGSLSSATTSRQQLLRPYPHFTGITRTDYSIGSSNYDSLQVKLSKRFSRGLSMLVAYTDSKLLRRSRYLNDIDAEPVKELASYDVPQRLVASGIYELPVGRSRRLLGNAPRPIARLVEGWQVNWSYTAESGVPLTLSGAQSLGRSARLPADKQSLGRWFDTTAFRQTETLEKLVTSVLPDVRSQGRNQIDLSLFKNTRIGEKVTSQFRAEAFNAFNRVEFGAPNMTFSSASFGSISSQINFCRQIQIALKLIW